MANDDFPLYRKARERGAPVYQTNGLPRFNRDTITQDEMVSMDREEGDLFAVFKDDFGATHVEYARMEDYYHIVLEEVVRKSHHSDEMLSEPENIKFLVGIVMISNSHGFNFDNFVQLLNFDLSNVYDSLELALWVEMNIAFWQPPAAEAVLRSASNREQLEAEYEELSKQDRLDDAA